MNFDQIDHLARIARGLECAEGLVFAVQLNLERDAYSAKTFAPALQGAYEYLSAQIAELRLLQRGCQEDINHDC